MTIGVRQQSPTRTGPLIGPKLSAPDVAGLVFRPRLESVLDAGTGRGVVVVSAPPGFGKTLLIASWARTRRGVAWLTLDEADRDPTRFIGYLVAALRQVAPRTAADDLGRVEPLPPFATLDDHYLAAIANALGDLDDVVVVVLDDFHTVVGSPTERLVERLLRYRPAGLRMVIASRVAPAVAAHRLRIAGELTEIRACDLAFTVAEAAALLAGSDVRLGPQDVARLVERTEGWAAALRLAAVSVAGAADAERFVEGFTGDDHYVGEYLLTEVLNGQREDVREFLLRTCVVDRICGDLANALTGGDDGGRMLVAVERANLFLVAVDRQHEWYRWHQLYAGLMRRMLHATRPTDERELHVRAAEWFADNGMPVDAVRHAADAGDWAMAARLIGGCWLELVMTGEAATLRSLLARMPDDEAAAAAEVSVAFAALAIQDGDLDTATRLAQRAQRLAGELPPQRRVMVEAAAAVDLLHVATMLGRDRFGARQAALAALDELNDPVTANTRFVRVQRTLLLYTLGAFETCDLQWDAAARHLRAALVQAAMSGIAHIQLLCYSQFISHDFRNGRLERAQQRALEVIEAAERRGWAGYHNLAAAHDNLAGLYVLRDELDAAMQHLATAADVVRPADIVDVFHITFLQGVVQRATGHVADARASLERLRALCDSETCPEWFAASVVTADADQLDAEGRLDDAIELLAGVDHTKVGASVTRPHGPVYAGLLVRQGRPAEARDVMVRWTRPDVPRPVRVAALVADAVAADALGLRRAALEQIERALELAREDRLFRPFVAGGPAVPDLLGERLDLGTAYEDCAAQVLARCRRDVVNLPHIVEPLTEREMDVLHHLQGTMSNGEIATRLFVSINTVKTHVKNINRKLGTTSRRQAVLRARELALL